LTIESSNLGPGGTFFVRGAPKSKNQKIFFSTKYIKWILLGKEKLSGTR
jgi:hypothetical protein